MLTEAALQKEVARRRTFAIISHPDAGKTTLTEKLLLYGGAIHLAGAVRAKANQRNTTSDWMEIEKQRGISISSSVLQFEYQSRAGAGSTMINLLDTPGHKDFSEEIGFGRHCSSLTFASRSSFAAPSPGAPPRWAIRRQSALNRG